MAYTDLREMTDRYGAEMLIRLTDRGDPPTGAVDQSVVAQAIQDAGALIDGYVAARYALPLATVPALIETLALHVAIYNLHVYEPDPKIAKDYDLALRSLEGISKGTIRLQAAGVETEQTGTSGVRVNDRERPFSPENMRGFI